MSSPDTPRPLPSAETLPLIVELARGEIAEYRRWAEQHEEEAHDGTWGADLSLKAAAEFTEKAAALAAELAILTGREE